MRMWRTIRINLVYLAPADDFVPGMYDAVSFGGFSYGRRHLGRAMGYGERGSKLRGWTHTTGQVLPMGVAVGRLAYSGASNALPLMFPGETLESAYKMFNARKFLKKLFRFNP
jgi:hypothetical protein